MGSKCLFSDTHEDKITTCEMRFLSLHGTKKGMRYTNECVKNEQHKNEGKEVMGGQHIEKMIQIANIIKTTLVLSCYVFYVILYSALLKVRILADKRVRYKISDQIGKIETKFLKNIKL